MRKIALMLCLCSLVPLAACSGADDAQSIASSTQAATAAAPDTYQFSMGARDTRVGEIRIWNDDVNIYVQYAMDAAYELADAHVCVSTAAFPWTAPGQCPYKQDPMPADTTSWMFTIPLADLGALACDTPLYLQVHGSILDALANGPVGSAYAGTFKGHIGYVYTCNPPADAGCTLTQGYWKNHPAAWPVDGVTLGSAYYTKAQAISLLKTPPRGDASVILAHQLIAAVLNTATGASAKPEATSAITAAQAWMTANVDADGRLPYGIKSAPEGEQNPAAWDEAVNLSAILDRYNNGELGPLHCE